MLLGAILSYATSLAFFLYGVTTIFADAGKWLDERVLLGPIVGTGMIGAAIVAVLFGNAFLSRVPMTGHEVPRKREASGATDGPA